MKRLILLLLLIGCLPAEAQVSTAAMKDTVNRYFQIPFKNPRPRVQEQATAIKSIIDWIKEWLDTKQATLVSGTNIKTVNGNTLLGSGDLVITGGVTGSGTTNYIAKWTGSGTLGNSLIFGNGSFIGFNTTTDPGVLFRANGAVQFDGNTRVSDGTKYIDIGLPGGAPSITFRRHSDNAIQVGAITGVAINLPSSVSAGYTAPGALNSVYYGERAFTTAGHLMDLRGSFTASSGTAEFNSLMLYPFINQTGSATGQTRGVWVRTVLTATTVPYRAIQWDNTSGYGLYGEGTAANYLGGKLLIGSTTDDGVNSVQTTGSIKATQFRLSALNTAPISATDTGTTGEVRITAGFIYVCTATNTWVRAALSTW